MREDSIQTKVVVSALVAFALIGCAAAKERPEPVKVGDFIEYKLTGEIAMVAKVPQLDMFPSTYGSYYGIRFKDGREMYCKGGELRRVNQVTAEKRVRATQ